MGNSLTVDSEPSGLDDLLDLDDDLLQHVHLKKEVPDLVNFHLKVAGRSPALAAVHHRRRPQLPLLQAHLAARRHAERPGLRRGRDGGGAAGLPRHQPGLADYLPKHILEAFSQLKHFKRESLACLMASSLSVADINERILAGGLFREASDPRRLEHCIFVWEGLQARAAQRAAAVSRAVALDAKLQRSYALRQVGSLHQCVFAGAVFFKKAMKKGKLTRIKTAVRIKLPENLKRKVRGQFVKNFLFRMLFSDRMAEQVEYNFKTVRQLTERPLSKVENVVYLLESVQSRRPALKPVASRRPAELYEEAARRVLTLDGSERDYTDSKLQAKGVQGEPLFFVESSEARRKEARDGGDGYPVIFQEYTRTEQPGKPEKKSAGVDFNFGPITYPLLNEKCEEAWRAKSKSRQSSKSKEKVPGEAAHGQSGSVGKDDSSQARKPAFRSVESAREGSQPGYLRPSSAHDSRKDRHGSGVSQFKPDHDGSSEQVSKRSNSRDTDRSASGQKISFENISAEPPVKKDEPAAKDRGLPEQREAPRSPEPGAKSQGDLLSADKPKVERTPSAIDQMNIKEEVIQEIDEEEDSEEARHENRDIGVVVPGDSESDEEPPADLPAQKNGRGPSEPRASVVNQLPKTSKDGVDRGELGWAEGGAQPEKPESTVDDPPVLPEGLKPEGEAEAKIQDEEAKGQKETAARVDEPGQSSNDEGRTVLPGEEPEKQLDKQLDKQPAVPVPEEPMGQQKGEPEQVEKTQGTNKAPTTDEEKGSGKDMANPSPPLADGMPPSKETVPVEKAADEPELGSIKESDNLQSEQNASEAKPVQLPPAPAPVQPTDPSDQGSQTGPGQETKTENDQTNSHGQAAKPDLPASGPGRDSKTKPMPPPPPPPPARPSNSTDQRSQKDQDEENAEENPGVENEDKTEAADPTATGPPGDIKSKPAPPPPRPPQNELSSNLWEEAMAGGQRAEDPSLIDENTVDADQSGLPAPVDTEESGDRGGVQDITVSMPGLVVSSDEEINFIKRPQNTAEPPQQPLEQPEAQPRPQAFKEDEQRTDIAEKQVPIETVKSRRPSLIKRVAVEQPVQQESLDPTEEPL